MSWYFGPIIRDQSPFALRPHRVASDEFRALVVSVSAVAWGKGNLVLEGCA